MDIAIGDDLVVLAQLHELFVVGEDGILIPLFGFHIDIAVVGRNAEPGLAGRKACEFACVPLHGGPSVVSGALADDVQCLFR